MKILVENASKMIKGKCVLQNINLELYGKRIYCLQGTNGSGKTMLIRLISGLIYPSEGRVLINGQQLGKDIGFPPSMGLMIENPSFLPNHTGMKNLELLARIQSKITSDDVQETIRSVGLEPNDKRPFRKYSLGMKQRLGIACAIIEKPDLILLDEPTNSLDEAGAEQICKLIQRERDRGALIILASHDPKVLESIADEIYVIHEGTLQRKV